MIRKYKKTLILTSLLTLLPIAAGLLLWNKLPDRFATHWGMDGQADGWSSLPFAVFAPPLIILAVQWLCVFVTAKDPGNKDQNRKMQELVLWIIPVISNLSSGLMYALALGAKFSITNVFVPIIGLMLVAIGNYLPKCKMNATMGIKIPWTYSSEENWNATHRFGGRVWFVGGLAMMLCGLVPGEMAIIIMLIVIFILVFIPVIYSYRYYCKQKAQGIALLPMPGFTGRSGKLTAVLMILLVVFLLVILFSGSIDVVLEDEHLSIKASFYDDLTVSYDVIDSVEYREGNVDGTRVMGFGSLKLLLGTFENEEFGYYTRYTYYKPEACIVLTSGDKILVISGKDMQETKEIYNCLIAQTEE